MYRNKYTQRKTDIYGLSLSTQSWCKAPWIIMSWFSRIQNCSVSNSKLPLKMTPGYNTLNKGSSEIGFCCTASLRSDSHINIDTGCKVWKNHGLPLCIQLPVFWFQGFLALLVIALYVYVLCYVCINPWTSRMLGKCSTIQLHSHLFFHFFL